MIKSYWPLFNEEVTRAKILSDQEGSIQSTHEQLLKKIIEKKKQKKEEERRKKNDFVMIL